MEEKCIEVRICEGKNTRKSFLSGTLAVKITQRQSRASHAVTVLQHGRSRSRKGKDKKKVGVERHVRAYRVFYNFIGWIGIKRHRVARAHQNDFAINQTDDESRDELTASRNKGAAFRDSAFSFISKRDVCTRAYASRFA